MKTAHFVRAIPAAIFFILSTFGCSNDSSTEAKLDDNIIAEEIPSDSIIAEEIPVDTTRTELTSSAAPENSKSSGKEALESSSSSVTQQDSSNNIIESSSSLSISQQNWIPSCRPAALYRKGPRPDVFDKLIEARAEQLKNNGSSEEIAKETAQQELLQSLGLDSLLKDTILIFYNTFPQGPFYGDSVTDEQKKNTISYLFAKQDSIKKNLDSIEIKFAETGIVEREDFCPAIATMKFDKLEYEATYFMENLGCAYGGPDVDNPTILLHNIWRKCIDLPYCNESHLFEFKTAGSNEFGINEAEYICKWNGWNYPTQIDLDTRNNPCTQEKIGQFMQKPSDEKYYICKDSGWVKASYLEMDTKDSICDEEGKRIKGTFDTITPYTCHNGEWMEFFFAPCSIDNERIHSSIHSTNKAYICYEGEWHWMRNNYVFYPPEYYFKEGFDYGTFVDSRDNRTYKTTELFGKTWISENMKYYDENDPLMAEQSACPQDKCEATGRYYSAEAAKKVCPEGWRSVNEADFEPFTGEDYNSYSQYMKNSYYEPYFSQIGSLCREFKCDTYGLSLVQAGYYITNDKKVILGTADHVYLWSISNDEEPQIMEFPEQDNWKPKGDLYLPVRCLKD